MMSRDVQPYNLVSFNVSLLSQTSRGWLLSLAIDVLYCRHHRRNPAAAVCKVGRHRPTSAEASSDRRPKSPAPMPWLYNARSMPCALCLEYQRDLGPSLSLDIADNFLLQAQRAGSQEAVRASQHVLQQTAHSGHSCRGTTGQRLFPAGAQGQSTRHQDACCPARRCQLSFAKQR